MAHCDLFAPKMLRLEGGFVNRKDDRGGPTNKGVTLATWRKVGYDKDGDGDIDVDDIRLLTIQDAIYVLKNIYWDRWKGDLIHNQSIAEILVDWVWSSGKWGIVIPQRILGLADDGIVGVNTLQAFNNADHQKFHCDTYQAREKFFEDIVTAHPDQKINLHGWLNRLNQFKYIV